MSRYPFVHAKDCQDQSTEFGWGPGMAPRQDIDFSAGGYKSGFPIADPDRRAQFLDLIAAKRTDLQNPAEPDLPAFQGAGGTPARMHGEMGNTERYGAQAPLVQQKRVPTFKPYPIPRKTRMQRSQDGGLAAAELQAAQTQAIAHGYDNPSQWAANDSNAPQNP